MFVSLLLCIQENTASLSALQSYILCSSLSSIIIYIKLLRSARDNLDGYILQDVYFDDESAEVVISSLRLGDTQER